MATKGMTPERARMKFKRENEFRLQPDDSQQVEHRRRGSGDEWEPYGFFKTVERAQEILKELELQP